MPRLSVVIPVLGNLPRFEETLVSVLQNRPDDCEIIAVFDAPYDDPYELSGEVRLVEAPCAAGLSGLVNLGICAATAPVIHLLCCGAEVDADWVEPALRQFDDPQVACVAPLVLDRTEPETILSAGMRYRCWGAASRTAAGKTVDQCRGPRTTCGPETLAGFYRRSALSAVGNFALEVDDELLGIDTGMALAEAGFRCVVEPDCRVVFDPTASPVPGALRAGAQAEWFFWRWGRRSSLAAHCVACAGEMLLAPLRPSNVLRLLGRLGGLTQIGSRVRRRPAADATVREATHAVRPPHFATVAASAESRQDCSRC